jgi:hypothetical protein
VDPGGGRREPHGRRQRTGHACPPQLRQRRGRCRRRTLRDSSIPADRHQPSRSDRPPLRADEACEGQQAPDLRSIPQAPHAVDGLHAAAEGDPVIRRADKVKLVVGGVC